MHGFEGRRGKGAEWNISERTIAGMLGALLALGVSASIKLEKN